MALGSAFFLYGVIAWLLSEEARRGDWWLHGAWCIGGVGLAAPVLLKTIQKGFGMVLRDHLFMFTGSFALYFLIGASFMTFGPSDEIAGSLRDYYVDAPMGLKTDALNAIGFGIALIVAAISPRGWSYRSAGRIARPAHSTAVSGVSAVAVDLPGFGASDPLRTGPLLTQLDRFVAEVVRRHSDRGAPVLAGNSLGAALTVRAVRWSPMWLPANQRRKPVCARATSS